MRTSSRERVLGEFRPVSVAGSLVSRAQAVDPADWAFAAFCAFIALARLVILVRTPGPVGLDGANFLAFGRAMFGEEIRDPSLQYPPLVPLAIVAATALVGPSLAISLVGVLASLAPAVGVHLVLRHHLPRWFAAVGAGMLAATTSTGESVAWGGYPQLIGLGVSVVFLAELERAVREEVPWRLDHSRRWNAWTLLTDGSSGATRWLRSGLLLAAAFATSHLIAMVAVVAGAIILTLRLPTRRLLAGELARALSLLIAPSLLFAPLYVHLLSTVAVNPSRPAFAFGLGGIPGHVDGLYRDFWFFWRPAVLLAAVTPLLLLDRRRTRLWALTTVMVAAPVVVFAAGELRYIYILPPLTVLALGCWVEWLLERGTLRPSTRVWGAVAAVVLLAQTVTGLATFVQQSRWYSVPRGIYEGMQWVREETPEDALVAVASHRDKTPLGWWAEGLARRRAIYVSWEHLLNFPNERARARVAEDLFAEGFPDEATTAGARGYGVTHAVVPKAWSGYYASRVRGAVRSGLVRVSFENDDVVVLELS